MKNEGRVEEMAQLLKEQASSGLSKKAFCADRGIPAARFYYWQKRLKDRETNLTQVEEPGGFHRIKVKRETELEVRLPGGPWIGVRTDSPEGLRLFLQAIGLQDA